MRTAKIKFDLSPEGIRANGQLIDIKYYPQGIVVVENRTSGTGHSAHPNISITGSIKGMKKLGYWKKSDKIVRAGEFYYNVSVVSISDELDLLAYGLQESRIDYLNPLALPEELEISI